MRSPLLAASLMWSLFVASWCVAMLWRGKAVARDGTQVRLAYSLAFLVGFTAFFAPMWIDGRRPWFAIPLWTDARPLAWALVICEAAGFAFAWWARIHLGRLWSGMIIVREGHRVVETGPYRYVRHPIYSGLVAALWCLALIRADAAGLAGAAILTVTMAAKAVEEEKFLRRQLGRDAYDSYASRTPMMVPFAPF
jgi:protein-S-isoprenylcysteine O-methyltransferase Ste14